MPCNPLTIPKSSTAQAGSEKKTGYLPYLQVIESLIHFSILTRPDIAHHMAALCLLMHDSTKDAYRTALDPLILLYDYSYPYTLSFWKPHATF